MVRISKQEAFIATLAYANVFGYTLNKTELLRWFLYYPIRNAPKHAVFRRKTKQTFWQAQKWEIAKRAGRWLAGIPSILLVGVTGGLAMNNAGRFDDIDIFIIVSPGTLWISRLLATLLMDILGLRRHPKDTLVANKICLNMFMTSGITALPVSERDCFSAHEVLQMVPLWEQEGIYNKFLQSNRWIAGYLPNAWKEKNMTVVEKMGRSFSLVLVFMRLFEWPVKLLQIWYMAHHRTGEIITDQTLRFHPKDARVWVKRKLAARLNKHHIPLDKVFYAR